MWRPFACLCRKSVKLRLILKEKSNNQPRQEGAVGKKHNEYQQKTLVDVLIRVSKPLYTSVCYTLCACVCVCVSQRCSKGREWWSGRRKARLMDIILMGSSSTTIRAIRTGKGMNEDWWWWTWSDCTQTAELMKAAQSYGPSSTLDIKVIFHFKR